MTFGERLLLALRRRRMTQLELSRMTGISAKAISEYIYNKHTPNADMLVWLAEALEVPPEWLVLGRRIKTRPLEANDDEKA